MTPDFLIIGGMKCGTTTLAAQLAAQPGVFMTTPKEPNFFSDDDIHARGAAWYHGLFASARPGDLLGEASTHYTKLPTYPQTLPRMQAMLEAPKLIYMIRNPVTRAVSHYIHEWTEKRAGADMAAAFETDASLVDYGRYAMQIAPFITAYGAASVHLTSLEQLKTAPQKTLAEIGTFLGRDLVWQEDLGAQNVSAERFRKMPLHGLLVDNPVARGLRRALVPKALREKVRRARSMTRRPELPDDLRTRLEAVYTEDRAALAHLFPDHPALRACYPFVPS